MGKASELLIEEMEARWLAKCGGVGDDEDYESSQCEFCSTPYTVIYKPFPGTSEPVHCPRCTHLLEVPDGSGYRVYVNDEAERREKQAEHVRSHYQLGHDEPPEDDEV